MTEVLKFLTDNQVFFLATTDGDQPRVRAMGFVMEWEGKLTLCTSNQKAMYRQMVANPNIEICCTNKEMVTLRAWGKAVFCTTEAAQKKALEVMPDLKGLYAPGDGLFEIFHLAGGGAVLQTMAGEKTELPL